MLFRTQASPQHRRCCIRTEGGCLAHLCLAATAISGQGSGFTRKPIGVIASTACDVRLAEDCRQRYPSGAAVIRRKAHSDS